ncbi:hypothetical protein [Mycolicibacterium pulveris]|uniref:hypothetical protein n=1 Tax=Mycolicibacterium pulveris TaxID=36813 RepID=UPI003CE7BDF0
MDLQRQVAEELVDALRERHMATTMAIRSDGYLVSVTEHPEASVHLGYGHLRQLKIQFMFDGGRPVPLDTATASDLADFVVQKVAGLGGGSPT